MCIYTQCVRLLTVVLSVVAEDWKQPKCPVKDCFIKCGSYMEWNTM